VTASVSDYEFGLDRASVTLGRPGQQPVDLTWTGPRTSGVGIAFAAPDAPGDWAGMADASGEFRVCENGDWLYGPGGARTLSPVTLTVSGAIVFLPLASTGHRLLAPTPAAPSPTAESGHATATATLAPSAPPGTAATQAPTPTLTATLTARPDFTPMPSLEPTPTETPQPEDRYLFLERWEHRERLADCPRLDLDAVTYSFDSASGILEAWAQPHLDRADIGYFGSRLSVSGMGSGSSSSLARIPWVPFTGGEIEVITVTDSGDVVFAAYQRVTVLAPGEEFVWESGFRVERCAVRTTLRIRNFGYQDRSKIVYH
jgi:hypothetical protein